MSQVSADQRGMNAVTCTNAPRADADRREASSDRTAASEAFQSQPAVARPSRDPRRASGFCALARPAGGSDRSCATCWHRPCRWDDHGTCQMMRRASFASWTSKAGSTAKMRSPARASFRRSKSKPNRPHETRQGHEVHGSGRRLGCSS